MSNKAQTVKSCDFNGEIAAMLMVMLNSSFVTLNNQYIDHEFLVSTVEPAKLIYPEGWYFAKGNVRNKHQSTTGMYYEIPLCKSNNILDRWDCNYCTLRD